MYPPGKYAITIAAKPYFGKLGIRPLLFSHMEIINRRLRKDSIDEYIIYPELSNKFVLHYHGVIQINDMVKYYYIQKILSREVGFVLIKPLTPDNKWTDYVLKEWKDTKNLLKISYPISTYTSLRINDDGKLDILPRKSPPTAKPSAKSEA